MIFRYISSLLFFLLAAGCSSTEVRKIASAEDSLKEAYNRGYQVGESLEQKCHKGDQFSCRDALEGEPSETVYENNLEDLAPSGHRIGKDLKEAFRRGYRDATDI